MHGMAKGLVAGVSTQGFSVSIARVSDSFRPPGCHSRDTLPPSWPSTVASDRRVPNPAVSGGPETGGPPYSFQGMWASVPSLVQETRPVHGEQAHGSSAMFGNDLTPTSISGPVISIRAGH